MDFLTGSLRVNERDFRRLLREQGPSLGLWRAAEVAALREQIYHRPILDVGCGDGFVMSLALPKIDIGLDPDDAAIARARTHHVYAHFEAVGVEDSSIDDGSIGTVVSNSVLEHLPGIDNVLQRIARMLRVGGRLIFTAPTQLFSKSLLLPFDRYVQWRNAHLLHVNLWSLGLWQAHLRQAGFEVEKVRCYLRPSLVRLWDLLELPQLIRLGGQRPFGTLWQYLPPGIIAMVARQGARLDLSAPSPGGGSLIVARKI